MFPSNEIPYGGVFVKNQYEYLKNNFKEHCFEIKAMKRIRTDFLRSIYKYFEFLLSSFPYLFRNYDVVHIHYFSFHFIFGFIYKLCHPKTKIILTLHGSDVNMFSENKLNRKLVKVLFKTMKVESICVGNKLAKNYFYKFNLYPNHILAAGVDDELFKKNENIEKIYDLIFVGTFSELKGVDLLCDVIRSSGRDYKWCFIGAGPYSDKLKKMAVEFNIDVFIGLIQNDIVGKLNQSKYFILLSRSEGFPLASLEALYCGVPVICSNIDQFKEQVIDNYNGFIITTGDVNRIKDIIKSALTIEKKRYDELSNNALNSNKEFSLKNVCEELIKIYNKESKK